MRYLWIALGIAALHRLVVVGLALLAFVAAMSAFGGGGTPVMMGPLSLVSAILDFPLSIFTLFHTLMTGGSLHRSDLSMIGMVSFVSPLWAQLASSLCIGTIGAIILYRRHKKKYPHLTPRYWKKGM